MLCSYDDVDDQPFITTGHRDDDDHTSLTEESWAMRSTQRDMSTVSGSQDGMRSKHDDLEEHSFVKTGVITTEYTSESSRQKNVGEEPDNEWSQRIRDESDSAFHKYQRDGGDHTSSTEESWTRRSKISTQMDTLTLSRSHDRIGMTSPLPSPTLQGGMRCQAVDSEQLKICSHEEKRRFYISAVIDPRNGLRLSVREVITFVYMSVKIAILL